MNTDPIKLNKYVWLFTAYYAAGVALINILFHVFELDLGAAVNFALFFSAAYSVAVTFVKDTQRVPTLEEKRKLSIACILSSTAVSVLYLFVALPLIVGMEDANILYSALWEVSILVWITLTGLLIGVQYLILHFIFGWFARKVAKKLFPATHP